MNTETIDKLFLELSQFTQAKTKRELDLERRLAALEQREGLLHKAVADALEDHGVDAGPAGIRAAILAVADWMEQHSSRMTAAVLRREVGQPEPD